MIPKVSIIIPIYNTEQYLPRCMDTVLNQTLQDIEIILVDDESPDSAPKLCEQYKQQDSRVKVVHRKNGGLGYARNSGIELATGEYVAFLDSDDYVENHMYEFLYTYAQQYKADTVFAGFYCNEDEAYPSPYAGKLCRKNEEIKDVLFNLLGADVQTEQDNKLGMSVWAGLYSMNLIKNHNIMFCSERDFICEDAIFHIDYYQYAKCVYIAPECFYHYSVNHTSLSRSFRKDRYDKDVILYQEEKRRLIKYGCWEQARPYVDRMFLAFARVYLHDLADHLGYHEAKPFIQHVMNDDVLQNVLREYPYQKNPKKQRLFNGLMARKMMLFSYLIFKIKK